LFGEPDPVADHVPAAQEVQGLVCLPTAGRALKEALGAFVDTEGHQHVPDAKSGLVVHLTALTATATLGGSLYRR